MNIKDYLNKSFKEYTDNYDSSNVKIKLKIDHTFRVADLSEIIAESIGLDDDDVMLAWICGMLHDVGRFEQVKRYGTFFDSVSVDHAQFGADLLFEQGLFEKLVPRSIYDDEKQLIENVIRVHNMFRVPDSLTERERIFADILRDADKVDIIKVNCDTPMEEVYNVSMDELLNSEVSEDVKRAFNEKRCAKRHDKTTAIDYLVGHVCLAYELVYKKSISLLSEQGYIYMLLDFEPVNPESRSWFAEMKIAMTEYLKDAQN